MELKFQPGLALFVQKELYEFYILYNANAMQILLTEEDEIFLRFSPLFTSISTRINDFHGDGQMAGLTGEL